MGVRGRSAWLTCTVSVIGPSGAKMAVRFRSDLLIKCSPVSMMQRPVRIAANHDTEGR